MQANDTAELHKTKQASPIRPKFVSRHDFLLAVLGLEMWFCHLSAIVVVGTDYGERSCGGKAEGQGDVSAGSTTAGKRYRKSLQEADSWGKFTAELLWRDDSPR
jgi:hypothetical protein